MERRKRSIVWRGFTDTRNTDSGKVKCKLCETKITYKGNTTNMLQHIKGKHPNAYLELVKTSELPEQSTEESCSEQDSASIAIETEDDSFSRNSAESTNIESPQQGPSSSSFRQTTLHQFEIPTTKNQQKIAKAIGYFIAVDMMPYTTVEKSGFQHLVKTLCPGYKIPSRKVFAEKVIPSLYNATVEFVQADLNKTTYLSITTDCWTSCNNEPYMAITAHYITPLWTIEAVTLQCKQLTSDHTGENIMEEIEQSLQFWKIPKEKVTSCTTDYGANIVKAVRLMNVPHVCCFGHAINTGVNHALSLNSLQVVIGKVKRLQGATAHSWKLNRDIKKLQQQMEKPVRKIPSFSTTRWWSLLRLMKCILEQHSVLLIVLNQYKKGMYVENLLLPEELNLLQVVVEAIEPFETLTEHLCGEQYITGSTILPINRQLQTEFEDGQYDETQMLPDIANEIRNALTEVLVNRYENNIQTNSLLLKVTFFDPRFKHLVQDEDELKKKILEELLELPQDTTDVISGNVNETGVSLIPTKKAKGVNLAAILGKNKKKQSATMSRKEILLQEMQKYISLPEMNLEDEPLQFWKTNINTFPFLTTLANKYLCVVGSSVPSERVFSKAGLIVTDLRSSLSPEHAEQLIFLSMNKKFVPK